MFKDAKQAIIDSMKLYFPDYNLRWIVRTDASKFGVGGALFQVKVEEDGSQILQILAMVSKKFSDRAVNWATIQQECYGIYFTLHKLQYYLRGKFFELETDHANLQWMEASDNPLIIRMRVFVQGLVRVIRHIPGSQNKFADFLSRTDLTNVCETAALSRLIYRDEVRELDVLMNLYFPDDDEIIFLSGEFFHMIQSAIFSEIILDDKILGTESSQASHKKSLEKISEACKVAHNSRVGHRGARKTWLALNQLFPGHKIPFSLVEDFIMACPVCQKDRLKIANTIPAVYRTIKSEYLRRAIGIDHVSVTPADEAGNIGLSVIVNLFSGHVEFYPFKELNAEGTCRHIYCYMCSYGVFDEIHSDPGSDLTSNLVSYLNKYLGTQHIFSLVDRHESNGVERTIQEILRHLRALVYEERQMNRWSDPVNLAAIRHILNNTALSERGGFTANQLTYGTADQSYYLLKSLSERGDIIPKDWPDLIQQLDANINNLREKSKAFQLELIKKRTEEANLEKPNSYQPGDFITLQLQGLRPAKLAPRYKGPYEVVSQHKNDITCRHLAMGNVEVLDAERVQLFIGSREQALEAANWDADQYEVKTIISHRGDPTKRSTLEFLVEFADGDKVWIGYGIGNNNISKTVQFESYCRSKPELFLLLFTEREARKLISERNKKQITSLEPGSIFYLDIRTYGHEWYESLKLPNHNVNTYVTKCRVIKWVTFRYKIEVLDESLGIEFYYRTHDVLSHAYRSSLSPLDILVDSEFLKLYPQVLQKS